MTNHHIMKQLVLIIVLILTMAFGGHGTAAAAQQPTSDRLQKVEHKEDHHEAVFTDASALYRICTTRPYRIVPAWAQPQTSHLGKLPYYLKHSQTLMLHYGGRARQESAPIHFDVASRYYVICLRHLLC